jgi:membrane protein DedA with SNARE-associated domain
MTPMEDGLGPLTAWATGIVEALGYPGVYLLMILEGFFPPIPSEMVLPLAGFLAGQGRLSLWLVLLVATAGSLTIALVLYGLGHWIGRERLRRWIERYGKWILLDPEDMDKTNRWFERHGKASVFFGRFVPGVRSLISLPAGFAGMPLWSFVIFTMVGSAIWNGALIGVGWYLGENWQQVRHYFRYFEYAAIGGLVLGAAWWIWKYKRKRGKEQQKKHGKAVRREPARAA